MLRVGIGLLFLYTVLRLRKIQLKNYPELWWHCFIIGIFANGLPWICFNYSIQTIPTSLSALINGTTPVMTIVLANIFLKDERLTWGKGIGVIIGLSGFGVLFLPTVLSSFQGTELAVDIQGILLSFIGSCSYAIGIIYVRRNLPPAPALVAPVMQLMSSLIYLVPVAFIFESPISMIQTASWSSWLGVLGLAVFGTALAFMMSYRIIERQGATAASTVTYLLPVFGTVLGVVFLEETIDMQFGIAAGLILSGVLIINGVISIPSSFNKDKIAS